MRFIQEPVFLYEIKYLSADGIILTVSESALSNEPVLSAFETKYKRKYKEILSITRMHKVGDLLTEYKEFGRK